MGREVRMVPPDWEHPKREENGRYRPMYRWPFRERVEEWEKARHAWVAEHGSEAGFVDWEGERPIYEDHMPEFEPGTATHYMMYENTSEGTPISPAFATPEELARWLADTGASAFGGMTATYEQWLNVARGGWAPSAVVDGTGRLMSGVEAVADMAQTTAHE